MYKHTHIYIITTKKLYLQFPYNIIIYIQKFFVIKAEQIFHIQKFFAIKMFYRVFGN